MWKGRKTRENWNHCFNTGITTNVRQTYEHNILNPHVPSPKRQGPTSTSGTAAMSGHSTSDIVRIHRFRISLQSSRKTPKFVLVDWSSMLGNAWRKNTM